MDGVARSEQPLFGDLLARPRERAIRYHLTSGTTGRTPLRVLDGAKDWQWIAECWCYGFWGVRRAAGGHGLLRVLLRVVHRVLGRALRCEKIGCLVLPSGNMTDRERA